MHKIKWGRLFRRLLALLLAAAAVGALLGTGGAWARSADFVSAALRVELGPAEGDALPFWARLAAAGSPLLAANPPKSVPTPSAAPEPETLPPAQPAPDRDDLSEEPPAATTAPDDIVERTLVPTSSEGYVTGAGLYLYNKTKLEVDLAEELSRPMTFSLAPTAQGPQLLIIHSHATEAYTPDGTDTYTPSDYSRTLDEAQNMVRIGDELTRVFTEMGIGVLHDRELYDYPQYNGSYGRSGPRVEEYLKQYPTVKLVLDVHRDGLMGDDGTVYKPVTSIDGVKTAQVMLVVGSDAGGGEHPLWRDNLALACRIQKALDTLYPTLARPMTLRQSVYNQNLLPGSLLVEVGSHGNTLQEALAGARLFARAAGSVFLGLEDTEDT